MSHAGKARRCVVIALAMMTVATFAPSGPALLLFAPLCLTALMVAAAQILASQHEKRSHGQGGGGGALHRVLSRPRRIARYSPHYAHGDESTVGIGYRL
jgi:hypothetical protein